MAANNTFKNTLLSNRYNALSSLPSLHATTTQIFTISFSAQLHTTIINFDPISNTFLIILIIKL